MDIAFTIETLLWWIGIIQLPLLAGLFIRVEKLREEIAQTKLHTAQVYATHNQVLELEERITAHLLRIERKLDTTALQAAALQAQYKNGGKHD